MISSTAIPPNIKNCMPEDVRKQYEPKVKRGNKTPEKTMHEQLETWLGYYDIQYIHPRMDKRTTFQKGVSDFIVWKGRLLCFVELKTENGRLSDEQVTFLEAQRKGGTPSMVARSFFEATQFIREVLDIKLESTPNLL